MSSIFSLLKFRSAYDFVCVLESWPGPYRWPVTSWFPFIYWFLFPWHACCWIYILHVSRKIGHLEIARAFCLVLNFSLSSWNVGEPASNTKKCLPLRYDLPLSFSFTILGKHKPCLSLERTHKQPTLLWPSQYELCLVWSKSSQRYVNLPWPGGFGNKDLIIWYRFNFWPDRQGNWEEWSLACGCILRTS